jgi:GTP pyrophosphokinase
VSLDHVLASGDNVEIFTSKVETAGPSQDWLTFVASPRARNKIRQWFSRERRVDMVEAGRDDLTSELRRERLPVQQVWKSSHLEAVVSELSYVDLDALLAAIGEHHVSAKSVAQRIAKSMRPDDGEEQFPTTISAPRRERRDGERSRVGVHVEGLDDVLVRLANCCTPVPGDGIIGFVTRGRGVSVHRSDCANAVSLMAEQATRMIEVEWDGEERHGATFVAGVEVVALDRSRLLRDVTNALADHQVNILSCQTVTGSDRVAKMRFEFEFANPGYLDAVIRTIKGVDSVYDAYRLIPGAATPVA